MKTVEIVSHCWAGKYRHYANALCYQLSSLTLHRPEKCKVTAAVCLDLYDVSTMQVIRWAKTHTDLQMRLLFLRPDCMGRRAIGRDRMALTTEADIVWFADVDQTYQEGCLDRLAGMAWPAGATIIHPKVIKIHRDHATGDAALNLVGDNPRLIDIDPSEFIDKRYNRAIGGVQIVQGDFARKHGYLHDHPKWQQPTDGRFDSCRGDPSYRSFCREHGRQVGVDLPGMYRLRHSQASHGRPPKL